MRAFYGKFGAVEVTQFALAGAGLAILWWQHLRPGRQTAMKRQQERHDADADLALSMAAREAESRDEDVRTVHLLYGLVQVEAIQQALRDAGVDQEALEQQVFDFLEKGEGRITPKAHAIDYGIDVRERMVQVYSIAHHSERLVRAIDLWAVLRGAADVETLMQSVDGSVVEVLERAVHGAAQDPVLGNNYVEVVLLNDDFSTFDQVSGLLVACFDVEKERAAQIAQLANDKGHAVVAELSVAEATRRMTSLHTKAREQDAPLRVVWR